MFKMLHLTPSINKSLLRAAALSHFSVVVCFGFAQYVHTIIFLIELGIQHGRGIETVFQVKRMLDR